MTARSFLLSVFAAAGLATAALAESSDNGALSEMSLGAEDAPVTMIEYASVTCNHCAHWHEKVFPAVKEDYIDAGKVRFILREYPTIPGHPVLVPRSYAGTMLARCAADKGGEDAYFAVMNRLFVDQQEWAFGEDARGELLAIAGNAGFSEEEFDACIGREDLKDHIDANIQIAAEDFGVTGTPGFIINGEYKRVFTFEDVSNALDEALEKASAGTE